MLKFVFCLRRKPHLSREEFLDYWLNKHGPLAVSFQKVLGFKKYVQLHTICTALDLELRSSRGGPEPFDGLVETWWESMEALQRSLADPEAQTAWATLAEDEQKFIEWRSSPLWFGEEHVMVSDTE